MKISTFFDWSNSEIISSEDIQCAIRETVGSHGWKLTELFIEGKKEEFMKVATNSYRYDGIERAENLWKDLEASIVNHWRNKKQSQI